jgi:hypothetical protein
MVQIIDFDINKIPVKITTSIPQDVWIDIKKNGWSYKDVLLSGYRARTNSEPMQMRINALESHVSALQTKLLKIGVRR